jgi:hypothetical protein
MKLRSFAFVLLIAMLACSFSSPVTAPIDQPNVGTVVAETMQALTTPAAATPTAEAPALTGTVATPITPTDVITPIASTVSVIFQNVSFAIPSELNIHTTPTTNTDVELPFINPSNGPMPQHIVLLLDTYPLQGTAKIMVFKASEYAGYSEMTQKIVTTLHTLQYQAGQPIPDGLKLEPFNAQARPLSFKNGQGLRFITEILTGVAPISSDQIFYYYQGITNDGAYFVSAVLPISSPFLASDGKPDAPIPSNGIPFPGYTNPNATAAEFDTYYSAVTEKLNTAAPEEFTPTLTMLDKMVQSLQITP